MALKLVFYTPPRNIPYGLNTRGGLVATVVADDLSMHQHNQWSLSNSYKIIHCRPNPPSDFHTGLSPSTPLLQTKPG